MNKQESMTAAPNTFSLIYQNSAFLSEIGELLNEPEYLIYLETLVLKVPKIETKIANRKRLCALWSKENGRIID